MAVLRVTIGCVIGLLLIQPMVLAETVEEKMQLYNYLLQAINRPDIIWIPVTIDDQPGFMTKQQLGKKVRKYLVRSGGNTQRRYDQIMQYYSNFSVITKTEIKDGFLPTLKAEIDGLATDTTNNSSSNSGAFGAVVNQLSSAEHLNGLTSHPQNNFQCPERNPGSKSRNRFDSNSNSSDNTYVECDYFRDGKLSYQVPYVNGKKQGVVLKYNRSLPHPLAEATQYSNGKKNGKSEMWSMDSKSGHSWIMRKSEYNNGKLHGEQVTYHEKYGVLSKTVVYNNGKPLTNCSYDKSGKLLRCTHY